MPRVTGSVHSPTGPAANAYVQLRDRENEFCGETHAGDDGRFVLYAVPGRWRLVSWLPGTGACEEEVEVGTGDLDVDLRLDLSLTRQPS